MRILMLTQFFHPIIGGIERHVLSLAQQLVERGHEVAVATMWQNELREFEILDAIRVYRLKSVMHWLPERVFAVEGRVYPAPLPDPILMVGLKRIIHEERPDIIHAHNTFVYSYLPLKSFYRIPVVETLHDYHLRCPITTMVHERQACTGPDVRKCLRCCAGHFGPVKGAATLLGSRFSEMLERRGVDLFVPVSQSVADRSGLGDSDIPYKVVPNFVRDNIAEVVEDMSQYMAQIPDGDFMIFVGAFGQHKGLDILLSAYTSLETSLPLVLIGYEVAESKQILKYLPPNVHVFLNWPNQAVIAAVKRSLFMVIPSICPDSCPTVVIEALSCGCPIVASNIGGIPDLVIHESTGLLCPPGDSDALQRAMERMIAEPALRLHMRENTAHQALQFRANRIINEIEKLYSQLVFQEVTGDNTTDPIRHR